MQRHEFPYLHPIATRWDDNDVYGHVNNVRYFAFFDTAINDWLIREGGLDVEHGAVIGVCAESHCAYTAAIAFPDAVEVGLRTERIGSSSVRYELAVFRGGAEESAATGLVRARVRRPRDAPPGPDPGAAPRGARAAQPSTAPGLSRPSGSSARLTARIAAISAALAHQPEVGAPWRRRRRARR